MVGLFGSLATATRIGAEALRVNPLRTTLSTLGVIIGVGSLVAVLSLGDGLERSARAQLGTTTPLQSISVSSRTVEAVDGDFFPLPDTLALGADDATAIRALPGVAAVRLEVQGRREMRAGAGARRMAVVRGVDASGEDAPSMLEGRRLETTDSGARPFAALLSEGLARRLAPGNPAELVGTVVTLGADSVRVVGITSQPAGDPPSSVLDLPYPVALRLLDAPARALPQIQVRTTAIEDVAPVRASIERRLASRREEWKARFAIATYAARAEQAAQGILIFKLLMGALTGISLLVGGIGIMNVLLASVTERTREIGIRRANGATRRDILLQFLSESVAISGFGSLLGIALGLGVAFGVTALIRRFARAVFIQASFSWGSVLVAALISILVGLAFGTYPARRAARLSPVDAIRHE